MALAYTHIPADEMDQIINKPGDADNRMLACRADGNVQVFWIVPKNEWAQDLML